MLHSEDPILLLGLLICGLLLGLKWLFSQLQEINVQIQEEVMRIRQLEHRLEPRKSKPSHSHLSKSGIRMRTYRFVWAARHHKQHR